MSDEPASWTEAKATLARDFLAAATRAFPNHTPIITEDGLQRAVTELIGEVFDHWWEEIARWNRDGRPSTPEAPSGP